MPVSDSDYNALNAISECWRGTNAFNFGVSLDRVLRALMQWQEITNSVNTYSTDEADNDEHDFKPASNRELNKLYK